MKHVLLVDDDRDMLMMMERWLKKEYQVGTAASGREAITYLNQNRPDLVMLDYVMSDMSGADTLQEIRRNPELEDLPVVILTGMEQPEDTEGLKALHPIGCWSKSMGKKALVSAVAELLQTSTEMKA